MLAVVNSCSIVGIEACPVAVEVDARSGHKSNFVIVGLADTAVRESKERVLAALEYCGFRVPGRILINLAPAELKKEGSSFDLAIAIGILAASKQVKFDRLQKTFIQGELALDGSVKPIKGAAALAIEAAEQDARYLIVPEDNYAEAALIEGIEIVPVRHISEVKSFLEGSLEKQKPPRILNTDALEERCFSEVQGQDTAKRAMMIAAAGGHNLLMIGPPGCGKSMLASRFSGILPQLSVSEKLEVVKVHSSAGLPIESIIAGARPFRAPHHVVSEVGLIGGGSSPRPGEISLAHHGVLFLDEFPEYRRGALEAMRAPLEGGTVQITRAKASVSFPADFQLVAAMNPCPRGGPCDKNTNCKCSPYEVRKYLGKLSEPILDRIDMHVELNPVPLSKVAGSANQDIQETSSALKQTVSNARKTSLLRQGKINSLLSGKEINHHNGFNEKVISFLEQKASTLNLSARGFIRCFRVSRTIADLGASQTVKMEHVAEALQYRSLERLRATYH